MKQLLAALGLLIAIAVIVSVLQFVSNSDTSNSTQEDAVEVSEEDYSAGTPYVEQWYLQGTPANNAYWTQVSGDSKKTCTNPTFVGEVPIRGWYEEHSGYDEERQWQYIVHPDDNKLLPGDLLGIDYTDSQFGNNYILLTNATPQLEETLKKATPTNPATVVLVEFSQYCEGSPYAKVKI